MLEWARRTACLSIDEVAVAEKIEAEVLREWEAGNGTPSLAMLRRLGERYKRPLQVFYLPSPQQGFTIVKDFRTIAGDIRTGLSSQLVFAIRQCQERQSWASQYLRDQSASPVELLVGVTVKSSVRVVAKQVRSLTGVTLEQQTETNDSRECLWLWRRALENCGVFVWQVSGLDVEEMRGFALVDKYAPVVVLNVADSYSARLFSLVHELGHILLGETAISNSGSESQIVAPQFEVEKFCNRLAAETLIPSDDIRKKVPAAWRAHDDDVLSMLASRYGVSRAVVVIRLVEIGLADQDYAENKLAQLRDNAKKTGGPVKQSIKVVSKNGEAFSRLAFTAFEGGEIHGGELTTLLGMKLKHLGDVTRRLYPQRGLLMTEEK